jgi:dihydrofolate reductase
MARLIYSGLASLDGYVADEDGNFDWAMPDEEVHTFINDLQRPAGTYLYGRRLYDVMAWWETVPASGDENPEYIGDFAEIWRAAEKVVYSTTVQTASTARTRIEPVFDPDEVRRMKATTHRDILIGGPHLAGQAIAAGLVDECQLVLVPAVVGGGTSVFPPHIGLELELLEERRFGNGMLYVRYGIHP